MTSACRSQRHCHSMFATSRAEAGASSAGLDAAP